MIRCLIASIRRHYLAVTTEQVKFVSHTWPRFTCTFSVCLNAVPCQGLPSCLEDSNDAARVGQQSSEGESAGPWGRSSILPEISGRNLS